MPDDTDIPKTDAPAEDLHARVPRQELESKVIAKAWKDLNFRSRLIDDPGRAIATEFGVHVPPATEVSVVVENGGNLYLVLPVPPPDINSLPDDRLRAWASGECHNPYDTNPH